MFAVARADHIEKAIGEAMLASKWVVCDRFYDSTRAYQGATAGPARAHQRARTSHRRRPSPDITFILDIPPEQGLARAAARRNGTIPDRFESQQLMLHERIRRAFLDIAEEEPERCVVIDASQPEAMVAEDVGNRPPAPPSMSMTAERTRRRLRSPTGSKVSRRRVRSTFCSATRPRFQSSTTRSRAGACITPGSSSARGRRQGDARLPLCPHRAGGRRAGQYRSRPSGVPQGRLAIASQSPSHPALLGRKSKRYSQWIGVEEVSACVPFSVTRPGEELARRHRRSRR